MFAKSIYGLEMTSEAADYVFENITGCDYGDDRSFLATLRALLYHRAGDAKIHLCYASSAYNKATAEKSMPEALVQEMISGYDLHTPGTILIRSINGSEDANTEVFKAVDSETARTVALDGFEEVRDLSAFLGQRKFRTRFFINKECRTTIIFAERIDYRRWHLLQALIPRYMPWFFEEQVTPEEFELIQSLTNKESNKYEELIELFAKKFDFRTPLLRKKLAGFEAQAEEAALNQVRDNINAIRRAIDEIFAEYGYKYTELQEYETKELGLLQKIQRIKSGEEKGESELVEFLLCNKAFNLVDLHDSVIEFVITTVISNYDIDLFDRLIKNENSCFYHNYYGGEQYNTADFTKERIARLMKAIFQQEKLKLRVCAAYRLNFQNGEYRALKNYRYSAEILRSHTPNQHIQYYACLGNNAQIIGKAMLNKDYIAAISACMSSASNMNMAESNTVSYFMEKILAPDAGKIIQMPDGGLMTPIEAARWLEEQDEQKQEKKKTTTKKKKGAEDGQTD